jgi:hypothetical protein
MQPAVLLLVVRQPPSIADQAVWLIELLFAFCAGVFAMSQTVPGIRVRIP